MKTLIIHVGPRKTGTTTIQIALLHNQDRLLKNGVLVPEIGRGYPDSAAQHNLAWELLNYNAYKRDLGNWEDLLKFLENRTEQKVILSSEVFSSLDVEKISKIREYLKQYDVKIITYLRRQDQAFQSIWAQNTKTGESEKVNGDFYNWLDHNQSFINRHGMDYYKLLDKWSSVFGKDNIIVRVLEKNQLNGTLFSDFLLACEVDNPERYKTCKNQNVSPGIKTIILISELKKRLEGKLDRKTRVRFYSQIGLFGLRQGWSDQKLNLIDEKTYNKIMGRYNKNNQKIAQEYFGREDLFLEPFNEKDLTRFSIEEFDPKEILDAFAYAYEMILADQPKTMGISNGLKKGKTQIKKFTLKNFFKEILRKIFRRN